MSASKAPKMFNKKGEFTQAFRKYVRAKSGLVPLPAGYKYSPSNGAIISDAVFESKYIDKRGGKKLFKKSAVAKYEVANESYGRVLTDFRTNGPKRVASELKRNKTARFNLTLLGDGIERTSGLNKLIRQLPSDGKYMMGRPGDKVFALTEKSKSGLAKQILDGQFTIIGGGGKAPGTESEEEMGMVLMNSPIIELYEIASRKSLIQGLFFPYTHNIKGLDLSDIGIWPTVDKKNYREGCLYKALESYGIPLCTMQKVKHRLFGRGCARKDLRLIAEDIGRQICVHRPEDTRIYKYGDPNKPSLRLNLVESHYFPERTFNIKSYAVQHFRELEGKKNWHLIRDAKGNKKKDGTSAYTLIQLLLKTPGALTPIKNTLEIHQAGITDLLGDEIKTLAYVDKITPEGIYEHVDDKSITLEEIQAHLDGKIDNSLRGFAMVAAEIEIEQRGLSEVVRHTPRLKMEKKVSRSADQKSLFVIDVETDPTGEMHEPIGWRFHTEDYCGLKDDGVLYPNATEMIRAIRLIHDRRMAIIAHEKGVALADVLKESLIKLWAHNAAYDWIFLRNEVRITSILEPDNGFVQASFTQAHAWENIGQKFQLNCSWKLIPEKLENFGKMFNLPIEKDVMPYNVYTPENRARGSIPIEECLKHLKKSKHVQFRDNCVKLGFKEGYCDLMKYCSYYCKKDCEVTLAGLLAFNESGLELCRIISEELGLEKPILVHAMDSPTLPAFAHRLLEEFGCYYGAYKLGGTPAAFIQQCVVGGRVSLRDNTPQYVTGRKMPKKGSKIPKKGPSLFEMLLEDFDGRSLYPSAIAEMLGVPLGKPKAFENPTQQWLDDQDMWYAEVLIKRVGKRRKFPLQSKKVDGVRHFTNEHSDSEKVFMDKIAHADFINFQEGEIKVLRGYSFNEGFNTTICKVVSCIYNQRLKFKAEGNEAMSTVTKLVMNSAYGKTIMKVHPTSSTIIREDAYEAYVFKYHGTIKTVSSPDKIGRRVVERYGSTATQYRSPHVGVYILSMAKRIMNRVMCTAEDNDIYLGYTDTDSIHLDRGKLPLLREKYKEQYGRELDGKNLGEFHVDFELAGCRDVYSEGFIALGKKCYADLLVGIDIITGEIRRGIHFRLKGVPPDSVHLLASQENCTIWDLYVRLYNGETLEFDLMRDRDGDMVCRFERHSGYRISTKTDAFTRRVRFDGNEVEIIGVDELF